MCVCLLIHQGVFDPPPPSSITQIPGVLHYDRARQRRHRTLIRARLWGVSERGELTREVLKYLVWQEPQRGREGGKAGPVFFIFIRYLLFLFVVA